MFANRNRCLALAAAISTLALGAASAQAAEPASCGTVRFSDVGWTDITATTATATVILKSLGYETDVKLLSVPVTYTSLKNKDIDVFLGNWMPTMEGDIAPIAKTSPSKLSVKTSQVPNTRWRQTPRAPNSVSRISRISPPTAMLSAARSTALNREMTETA